MKMIIRNTFEVDGEDYEVTQSYTMWVFNLKEKRSRGPRAI